MARPLFSESHAGADMSTHTAHFFYLHFTQLTLDTFLYSLIISLLAALPFAYRRIAPVFGSVYLSPKVVIQKHCKAICSVEPPNEPALETDDQRYGG